MTICSGCSPMDSNESSAFAGDATLAPEPAQTSSNYLRGMVAALKQAGVPLTGADLAIGGDLPMEARALLPLRWRWPPASRRQGWRAPTT